MRGRERIAQFLDGHLALHAAYLLVARSHLPLGRLLRLAGIRRALLYLHHLLVHAVRIPLPEQEECEQDCHHSTSDDVLWLDMHRHPPLFVFYIFIILTLPVMKKGSAKRTEPFLCL